MDDEVEVAAPAPEEAVTEIMDATPMDLSNENEDKEGLVKVSNISPQATVDQMKKLFGFLGNIQELALYPKGFVYCLQNILITLAKFYASNLRMDKV